MAISPGPDSRDAPKHVDPARYDAVLLDLDGVLTDTARLHAACWKEVFDPLLARRGVGAAGRPFDADQDYRMHVDGKARLDGVRDFLASRGIELPDGEEADESAADAEGDDTVRAVARRKDALVSEHLAKGDVAVFPDAELALRRLRQAGLRTALVSSSHHAAQVVEAVGLTALFDARVDGCVVDALGLRGKPVPDAFLEAARRLGVPPGRAVVVEDAVAGVQAGRAGGFALVVGVARHGAAEAEALRQAGADCVVRTLEELLA